MTLKHKGSGYSAEELISQAAVACAKNFGCSSDHFCSCAKRFAPTAKTLETAIRMFADWHGIKEFSSVERKMNCEHHGASAKASIRRSKDNTMSVQVAA